MSTPRPILFRRRTLDLLAEIERDLRAHADLRWQGQKDGPGQALVRLYGRYADVIVSRLNQAPQQHFLAFLSEGGIDQLPPRAATTQLLFVPENDARSIIPVPAGTQVTARAAGQQTEIIFETTQDVKVIPTRLVRAMASDYRTVADQTELANDTKAGSFAAWQGSTLRERVLFLRDDALLTFPDNAVREHSTITVHFETASSGSEWRLTWYYWDGKFWTSLTGVDAHVEDGTEGFQHSGNVRMTHLPMIAPVEVNGIGGVWLACQMEPDAERPTLPQFTRSEISREIAVPEQEIKPVVFTATQAGAAFVPVKPEDPFYPFGQFPALLDGLYIQADEALTKPGAMVELLFECDGLPPEIEDTSMLETLEILWDYSSKEGWTPLGTSRWGCPALEFADRDNPLIKDITVGFGPTGKQVEIILPEDYALDEPPPGFPSGVITRSSWGGRLKFILVLPPGCEMLPNQIVERGCCYTSERLEFRDTTCAFTAVGPGVVSFRMPAAPGDAPPFAPVEVNGQTGYWLRARIVGGAYSAPQAGPSGLLQRLLVGKIQPPPPTAVPPLVRGFKCGYRNYKPPIEGPRPVQDCLGKTDSGWHRCNPVDGSALKPLTTSAEEQALYLGFSPLDTEPASAKTAFPSGVWIELYVGVEEADTADAEADLTWEYWGAKGWEDLDVVDETQGLRRPGIVGFFGPPEHRPSTDFFRPPAVAPARTLGGTTDQTPSNGADVNVYWLRVRPLNTRRKAPIPRVTVVRLNVAPAVNGESVSEEILGSSNGRKNQKFTLSRPPVLPDVQIEVQEPVEKSERSDKVWITWSRAPTLLPYDETSRYYVLDPTSGTITFGDNQRGMIPPAGQNNIRARRYRTHNGEAGNLAANTINVMRNPKDALNEIRRMTNAEPATGGAGLEETALVELRGPHTLKHRNRAITAEDFEWLAREIAGVRHVYCLPTRKRDGTTQPGWVTAVVVPERGRSLTNVDGRSIPTPSLLRQVREYLEVRGLTNLARPAAGAAITRGPDPDQIEVTGAGFVEVQVVADVVARDPTRADSIRTAILKQLDAFLDPVDGGPERDGWEPGRDVYISEVRAEIESVPGVDHVKHVFMRTPSRQQQFLILEGDVKLAAEMPAGSQVSTFDQRIQAVLVDTLPSDVGLTAIPACGFNHGESITILGPNGPALPNALRTSILNGDPARVIFDPPVGFVDGDDFNRWWSGLGSQPAISGTDDRVRNPIAQPITHTDQAGRVYLSGVIVSIFVAGEPVSITHAEHSDRRVDFLPVKEIVLEQESLRVFVPADHLVFSGKHDITMVLEGKHAG